MNCCKDNNNDKDSKNINEEERSLTTGNENNRDNREPMGCHENGQAPARNHKSHLLHMALCCGLPLLILLVLPLIGYKGILQSIAPFICPVMMLIMMPMMMRGHGKSN